MACFVHEQSLLCLEDEMTRDLYAGPDDDDNDVAASSCPSRRAWHCPTLLTDDRVLSNLLTTERCRRPSADCFCQRQTEVLPYMRDTVVTWMLEVLHKFVCSMNDKSQ